MAKWDQALTTGSLVSPQLMQAAFTPGETSAGKPTVYGFGWFLDTVSGQRRAWHGGGTVGFRTHFVRLPEDRLSLIVLMIHDDAAPEAIADHIATTFLPALKPAEPRTFPLAADQLRAFEGYYDFRGSVTAFVAGDDNLLWYGIDSKPVVLKPDSPSSFFYESADINPDRSWRLRFDAGPVQRISQISYLVDGKLVFTLPAVGRLCSKIVPRGDPDPGFTRNLADWVNGQDMEAWSGIDRPPVPK